jgi:hydrogenase maturation protease
MPPSGSRAGAQLRPGPEAHLAPTTDGALVIGVGNALRGDDALGWHAVARLRADDRLAGARVVWHHQLTPELAHDVAAASRVVIVDAQTGIAPGTLAIRRLDQPGGGGDVLSHHVAPEGLLALARELFGAAPEAWIVGVGVEGLGLGDPLSPVVEAALPAAVDAVASLAGGSGGA